MAVRPSIQPPENPRRLPAPVSGCVRLEGVSVRYGAVEALRQLNLTIPPGSRVAIVGRTAAGKSTLVRLIPRLIDPAEGCVTLDGVDVRQLSPKELRAQIGLVPQETFLFSATLAQNIALGAPAAADADVRRAAELAGLASDIAAFPAGYDTLVGERGVLLSGGQKQRVAIARALVRKPRVLIFDDALSSVDAETAERILDHLDSHLEECTTILVTHRLSSVRRVDRVVMLEGGRIVEQGAHEELLTRGNQYARLWRQHELESELETV
jgi:ATP-binding cassette subfamily B protein